jgi:hypothetical protein
MMDSTIDSMMDSTMDSKLDSKDRIVLEADQALKRSILGLLQI